jgi:4-hydroxy-tetrahydrodipicolinate synthase
MVAPPCHLRTDDQIFNYFDSVAETLGATPFTLQDYPLATQVQIATKVILRIVEALRSCVMLKHEDWPGLAKIAALRAASDRGARRISILTGNGGLFLPEELERGADGAMTGFAYPEMMVGVERRFAAAIPSVRATCSTPIFPWRAMSSSRESASRCLARRGAIASPALREPGATLSPADIADVERLIARQTRRLQEIG